MSSRKSILFVMNTMGRAGAERALIELMRLLDPKQYRISLYVLIPRGELFAEVPGYVHILNRHTDSRSVLSTGGKIYIGARLGKALLREKSLKKALGRLAASRKTENEAKDRGQGREKILRRALADGMAGLPGEYDLAVAYLEGPATWYVAEKVKAVKKAAFLHIDYGKAGYSRELDQGCYERMDRIYAVSGDVKEQFLKVYPDYADKVELFFNIINREHIRARALEPGGFADEYDGMRLLSVGRLYYQKGYDIAVRTAAILRERGRKFRWYILGEGEEKKNLLRQIKEEGLQEFFWLMGAVDNPYPYFKQADIYVCTSRFEGKSLVIEEAMALGKPVVASACTGTEEQIHSGEDGVIVPLDPKRLADEIERLMDNPAECEKYGKAAYQRELSYEKTLADFLRLAGE